MCYMSGAIGESVLILLVAVVFVLILHSIAAERRRGPRGKPDLRGRGAAKKAGGQGSWCCPPPHGSGKAPDAAGSWECVGDNCRAPNRPHARFCRMCGRPRPPAET